MSLTQAQQFIKQGDLKKASEILRSLSNTEKESSSYQKTLNQFQKKQTQLKQSFIKKTLQKAKNSDPKTAINLYQDILSIDPNNSKAQKQLQKKHKHIHQNLNKTYKEDIKNITRQTKTLIKQNQTKEALNIIYSNNHIPQELRERLELQTKREIIDYKLNSNRNKLKETPAPQKFDFLKKLYELEPTYIKIQKELTKAQKQLQNYSKIQKKNITKELLLETKILYNQHKFTKAKQTAQKLISIDPDNRKAKNYYNKAKESYYTDSFRKAYKILHKINTK